MILLYRSWALPLAEPTVCNHLMQCSVYADESQSTGRSSGILPAHTVKQTDRLPSECFRSFYRPNSRFSPCDCLVCLHVFSRPLKTIGWSAIEGLDLLNISYDAADQDPYVLAIR